MSSIISKLSGKFIFLLIVNCISIGAIAAQPATMPLDQNQYVTHVELQSLLAQLKSAPKIHNQCLSLNDCKKTKAYADAIYNLREDILVYQSLIARSKEVYKKQWQTYLDNTITNANTSREVQLNLAGIELLANGGSILLDLANIGSFYKNKTVAKNIPELLLKLVDQIDVILSTLDIFTKFVTADPGNNVLTVIPKDSTIYKFYTLLKGELDIIKASITSIDDLKKFAKAWKTLSKPQRAIKLDNPSITGVFIAIGNLLGLVASYEIEQMQADLDKINNTIKKDQNFQTDVFDKYHYHYRLLDLLKLITMETNYSFQKLRDLNADCFNAVERFPRENINRNGFAEGLSYYKPFLSEASRSISKSWQGLKDCPVNLAKPYEFIVLDGVGTSFNADLKISYNFKDLFYGSSNTEKPIELLPQSYSIFISDNSTKKRPSTFINKFKITGTESQGTNNTHMFTLRPYGRLQLDVFENTLNPTNNFSTEKRPIEYTYTILSNKRFAAEGESKNRLELDLPANQKIQIIIKNKDNKEIKKDVILNPTESKTVEVLYENLERVYRFKILDGIGEVITPYIKLINAKGDKIAYDGPSKDTSINIVPGTYTINISEGIDFNFFRVSKAIIPNYNLGSKIEEEIVLKPYGRVYLEVVDKEGKPVSFRYVFSNNGKQLTASFTASSKMLKTDLQASVPLRLELNYEYISEMKTITLKPGVINKLHYVYDDGKFIEDKIELIEIPISNLQVKITSPIFNSSNKNIIDFSASSNIVNDTPFTGYLNYNGIKQQVKPEGGNFSAKIVLNNGINHINFSIKKKDTLVHHETIDVSYFGMSVRLKAVLVWDSKADIDLHLRDPNNEECYYKNKVTKLASLDVDNKIAYGPENINVESSTFGEYRIYINNYSKTSGVKATVYIFIDGKLDSVTEHKFSDSSNYFFVKSITF